MLSAAAAVALVFVGSEFWPKPPGPVDFWVGTATTSSKEGAALQALANEALDLRFSEGTTLHRLLQRDARQAHAVDLHRHPSSLMTINTSVFVYKTGSAG